MRRRFWLHFGMHFLRKEARGAPKGARPAGIGDLSQTLPGMSRSHIGGFRVSQECPFWDPGRQKTTHTLHPETSNLRPETRNLRNCSKKSTLQKTRQKRKKKTSKKKGSTCNPPMPGSVCERFALAAVWCQGSLLGSILEVFWGPSSPLYSSVGDLKKTIEKKKAKLSQNSSPPESPK